MKVSFIIPCRDKAKYVGDCVRSVLAQSYSPMEIVLSDQGSVDGSFEIMSKLAAEYKGPNTVRVLQCPDTEMKGMAGLNRHLNWLHTQITGDIVIMCSADDLNHPDRVKRTVEAFEKHNPSYVGTCVQYCDKDGKFTGEMTAVESGEGFIDPVVNIDKLIGSSASSAWARDLFEKYGPLERVEAQDITLPFLATLERGLYYVPEPLHAYFRRADVNNTGMEGVVRAAETEEDKHAATETCNYHFTSIFMTLLRRCETGGINITQDLFNALVNKLLHAANIWTISRDNLTMLKIPPRAMRA
jgi:glycosyltransferase involved in cell wall biosynthesis